MAKKGKMLTTSKFSQLTGISVSTLNKWIRDGKIKGEKQSGKWMIGEDQLKAKSVQQFSGSKPAKTAGATKKKAAKPGQKTAAPAKKPAQKAKPGKAAPTSPAAAKAYTVDEFSAMTYLTDAGVEQFLKKGRLKGEIDSTGTWKVYAENLLDPLIKHLVR